MVARLLAKIIGTANDRKIKQARRIVEQINAFEPAIKRLSDVQLAHKTVEFRQQYAQGKTLDELLPEAFAVVREAAFRTIGQRHFDVQLIGGITLHKGGISEMRTGEGKTLTATLPLYLNALTGKSVHLVTVNDYLARRDSEWMAPVFQFLGLTVACLQNDMEDSQRQEVYKSDILYATNNELGFDYLRDNMKFRKDDFVQRPLYYAIVDEVDSILIDEARTPLIISGAVEDSSALYVNVNRVISRLQRDVEYEVNEKDRLVALTESGTDAVETAFGIDNLYDLKHMQLLHHVNQALRAHGLFRRDVDYVVVNNEVLIVDEFTGRILGGRRYSDGLHQALEAKEGVPVEQESQTLATITLQNFFRLYEKLGGMTGTAATEAEEFYNIYKLEVTTIPTNREMIRQDKPDYIFLTKKAKFKAIVEDIRERQLKNQPVLIGTIAVETSEMLSAELKAHGIVHEVLNAKQNEREAEIIALAGQAGRVTIATNMAGRGTDIKLSPESIQAGGLYILGTERHESRRIDNQLRGRSGRQGDPGESRFYISLEDDLIRIFAGDSLKNRMQIFGMKEDEIIESRFVSRTIERAQEKVEKHNFEIRKHLLEYDDVLNQQRAVVYRYRRDALEGAGEMDGLIRDFIIKVVQDSMAFHAPKKALNSAIVNELYKALSQLTGIKEELFFQAGFNEKNSEQLEKDLIDFILTIYEVSRKGLDQDRLRMAEKWLLLNTIDQAWKQHMLNLDHLKEGIGLRSWGQKNPLIEYKREAYAMFKEMMENINVFVVGSVFHLDLERFNPEEMEEEREEELKNISISSAPSLDALSSEESKMAQREEDKVGRNDQCPCGSGKKYKKCCGA